MQNAEFVEMAAGLRTSSEMDAEGSTPDAEATLDSMIGVARDIEAQTFASAKGLMASQLFDELGEKIMGLKRGARVIVRHRSVEVIVAGVEFRDNAVVLEIEDVVKGESREI